MHDYVATMTSKGQVTVPVGVRRSLGIEAGDQVTFIVEGNQATIQRVEHTIESVFQSVPTPQGLVTGDFDELIEEAMADHADEFVRREGSK
jgi:antitoxin PrlF